MKNLAFIFSMAVVTFVNLSGYAQGSIAFVSDTISVSDTTLLTTTVSATRMNIMYRGIENPIEVALPNFGKQVIIDCSGGTMRGSNGKYFVKPGAGREVIISVSVKMDDGKILSMGSYKFRVKSVPVPIITWAGQRNGGTVNTYAGNSPLIPMMEDFDFDVYAVINSFDISYEFEGTLVSRLAVLGNQIPSDLAVQIKLLLAGTKIYFDSIKITVPGGEVRTTSAVFTLQ